MNEQLPLLRCKKGDIVHPAGEEDKPGRKSGSLLLAAQNVEKLSQIHADLSRALDLATALLAHETGKQKMVREEIQQMENAISTTGPVVVVGAPTRRPWHVRQLGSNLHHPCEKELHMWYTNSREAAWSRDCPGRG
ncbi:hypothetical protein B0H14DRAFT_2565208 [Mycena olivaceomarginata]|nr:hypothetical protein B0H14DRAFT_2565208 [Mycena olivaceomarginata]